MHGYMNAIYRDIAKEEEVQDILVSQEKPPKVKLEDHVKMKRQEN